MSWYSTLCKVRKGLGTRLRVAEFPKFAERVRKTHKYGNMGLVKTTLEIPDIIFRRAKSAAAERGIPLRQLVTEAVQEKLRTTSQPKPWMAHMGQLKPLRREKKQIEKRVEEAFEKIDREHW
jgi:hypothetical protein